MGYYVYITGVLLTFILIIVEVFWLKRLKTRLELMKLSLTLIPYEVLMEPKTVSVLKTLNEVWNKTLNNRNYNFLFDLIFIFFLYDYSFYYNYIIYISMIICIFRIIIGTKPIITNIEFVAKNILF